MSGKKDVQARKMYDEAMEVGIQIIIGRERFAILHPKCKE